MKQYEMGVGAGGAKDPKKADTPPKTTPSKKPTK
jgi:hypothetical protein